MKKAGYEYLLAYKITVPIYDYTVEFCHRCNPFTRSPSSPISSSASQSPLSPPFPHLSSPRTHDQMTQAARSGMQNIPEGNKQESLSGYIRLSGVARGSLEELLKDFLSYARQHKIPIWDRERAKSEIWEIGKIWEICRETPTLPDLPDFPNLPHDPVKAVNLMITLINQANYLIDKLVLSLKETHMKKGGLTEELHRKRMEYRGNHRRSSASGSACSAV